MTRYFQNAFTLVELMIVVVLLAILSSIIVSHLSSSTTDTRLAALDTTLATIRDAIERYAIDHGRYPGASASTNGSCPAGSTSGSAGTEQAFTDQLTLYSNDSGNACGKKDAKFNLGPYLIQSQIPPNPITEVNTVTIIATGKLGMVGDGPGLGWKFDVITGQFIANDTSLDANGVRYDMH